VYVYIILHAFSVLHRFLPSTNPYLLLQSENHTQSLLAAPSLFFDVLSLSVDDVALGDLSMLESLEDKFSRVLSLLHSKHLTARQRGSDGGHGGGGGGPGGGPSPGGYPYKSSPSSRGDGGPGASPTGRHAFPPSRLEVVRKDRGG
jgi:hypothetical protein